MKNKDLIEILSKQDLEADVFLEYDTMCCVSGEFTVASVSNHEEYEDGIYLMYESGGSARWLFNEKLYGKEKYIGHTLDILYEGLD